VHKQTTLDPDFLKGESFIFKNNDSAFYYLNRSANNSKDKLSIAYSYSYLAMIQTDAGDNFLAQESLLKSIKVLNEKNPKHFTCLASNYNELGLISFNLKAYDEALRYYALATRFSVDTLYKPMILNNTASVYRDKKEYANSIEVLKAVLSTTKTNTSDYARFLTNLAFTKWLQNNQYKAAPELLMALQIRIREKDERGQNSSFSHLSDYYAESRPDSSLLYAGKMFATARKINSPDDELAALQKLIRLSPPKATRYYFEIHQLLNDSLQNARSNARNQYAMIQYESEKNKTDNLMLQKDNAAKEYQIALLSFAVLVVIIGSIFWYRKRKQRLELEARNSIRENQLKTSKKVHDVVANGLYRMMKEIENRAELNKEQVIDKIDHLYEKSRDISYDNEPFQDQNFHEKMSQLLRSFASEDTKVLIVGNTEALWNKISAKSKYEVEHILQELMVNMGKHSKASNVVIKFEEVDQTVLIQYADNGIGLSDETQFKNGLINTGNRIKNINGEITFDHNVNQGLKIRIVFPFLKGYN